MSFVDDKLKNLLDQKCIVKNEQLDLLGFVSNIFLVPKKEKNSFRMILNLKQLNKFINPPPPHFKMESIKDVQRLTAQGFWICTCDIVDAFPHMGACGRDQKLLQFQWRGVCYSFCTMPQGLATAPYEFTRIYRKIASFLRKSGVYCVFYIDDVIVIGSSFEACHDNLHLVINTLESCGFLINYKKSLLIPAQGAPVLGFWINSVTESISLNVPKCASLIKIFSSAVKCRKVQIKEFAQWIGLCISILPCFPHGKMHYRQSEHSKLSALRKNHFKWDKTMHVSDSDIKTLHWWLQVVNNNKPHVFRVLPISAFLSTDSSDFGWGCCLNSSKTAESHFSHSDAQHQINSKELLAVYYSVKTFQSDLAGHHFLLKSDSTTALADLRKMGSMCSKFRDNLVQKIFTLLDKIKANISVSFIRGCWNTVADEKSRVFTSETSEWALADDTFQIVKSLAPDMDYDLFASHLNNKFPDFCSWFPTPGCHHTDAFTFDWNSRVCYCFPPSSLYLKCFDYIRTSRVERVYFVVPWQETAVWFPLMINLLVDHPHFLPNNTAKKLFLPFPSKIQGHPLRWHLRLTFVHLSGRL